MSKTLIITHIVFCTKHRNRTLNPDHKRDLYNIIYNICKKNNCWVFRINGMTDHIHLLLDLSPTVALASLIKEIKVNTNKFLTNNPYFPNFENWSVGYFAVSVSPQDKEKIVEYIVNQQVHHAKGDFLVEIENLINENGMQWYIDDWI